MSAQIRSSSSSIVSFAASPDLLRRGLPREPDFFGPAFPPPPPRREAAGTGPVAAGFITDPCLPIWVGLPPGRPPVFAPNRLVPVVSGLLPKAGAAGAAVGLPFEGPPRRLAAEAVAPL